MPYPFLFAIIGALTGLFVSQVTIHTNSQNINNFLFTQILLVAVFSFVWKKQSNATVAKSLVAMGVILFGLTFWFTINDYHHIRRISPLLYFLLIQITVICTAFIQSWRSEKPHWVYSDLFENAWNNQFFLLFSALLTGGFLGVLALGTLLFDSIGIELSDLIWRKEVAPVIIATLVGAGIGIAREYGSLIFKIRSVFFAIFRVMAYLAAAIVILFTLSLPFSLDSLFQNKNTSLILLSVVAVSILLLNTLLDTSGSDEEHVLPVWKNRIFSAQIILLPFLSGLSIYAISIRLFQYGAMPKRIIALTIAVLLTCYGLAYLYQLIRRKGNWINGLAVVNPPLAVLWVVTLIALASPLVDPIRLSVNNQVERLQSNIVSPDKFDFYALKFRLGERGKAAIEDIRTWKDHPQFALIEKNIDKKMRYGHSKRQLSITIIGDAPANVDQLKSKLNRWRCNEESPCFIKQMAIDETGDKQVFVFNINERNTTAELYVYEQNWWRLKKTFSELDRNSPPKNIARGTLTKDYDAKVKAQKDAHAQRIKDILKALKQDQQKLIEPKYLDIEVGGIKLRQ